MRSRICPRVTFTGILAALSLSAALMVRARPRLDRTVRRRCLRNISSLRSATSIHPALSIWQRARNCWKADGYSKSRWNHLPRSGLRISALYGPRRDVRGGVPGQASNHQP